MKIDGYVEADENLALKKGALLKYKTRYGMLEARVKHTGTINKAFQEGLAKHQMHVKTSQQHGYKLSAEEEFELLVELYLDHVILSWSTEIKSDGKPIEATNANFIELMKNDQLSRIFLTIMEDAQNMDLFTRLEEEKTAKN